MDTEILPIDDADRAKIRSALSHYTVAIANAPDPTYWSPKKDVPYVFDGSVEDINVLYRVQHDGPSGTGSWALENGTWGGWWSIERDALVWANAVVQNTSFEWGKLTSGELCIWREDCPRLLFLPHARFFEAFHSSLSNAAGYMTASIVNNRFIFECLHIAVEEKDIEPLFAALDDRELDVIRAALQAYRSMWYY